MMKCVDCGTDVPEVKSEKELKIEFNNPGTVFVNASVMECPKCKSKYSDDSDATKIFKEIEQAYSESLSHKK